MKNWFKQLGDSLFNNHCRVCDRTCVGVPNQAYEVCPYGNDDLHKQYWKLKEDFEISIKKIKDKYEDDNNEIVHKFIQEREALMVAIKNSVKQDEQN